MKNSSRFTKKKKREQEECLSNHAKYKSGQGRGNDENTNRHEHDQIEKKTFRRKRIYSAEKYFKIICEFMKYTVF